MITIISSLQNLFEISWTNKNIGTVGDRTQDLENESSECYLRGITRELRYHYKHNNVKLLLLRKRQRIPNKFCSTQLVDME